MRDYIFESIERNDNDNAITKTSIYNCHAFETIPGRGGQIEVTPDQTSFERTHVPGALELHGLEKASSALSSGQWSGTCLIRDHFGLGRSDQRRLRAHTCLIRDNFERTLI